MVAELFIALAKILIKLLQYYLLHNTSIILIDCSSTTLFKLLQYYLLHNTSDSLSVSLVDVFHIQDLQKIIVICYCFTKDYINLLLFVY